MNERSVIGHRPTASDIRKQLDIAKEEYHLLGKATTVCVITLRDGREVAGVNTYWGEHNDEAKAKDMAFRKAGTSGLNALQVGNPARGRG